MFRKVLTLAVAVCTAFTLSSVAHAEDAVDLQQQIEVLNQKIASLEEQSNSQSRTLGELMSNGFANRVRVNGFASFGVSKTQDPRGDDAAYYHGQSRNASVSPNTWLGLRIDTQLYSTGELIAQFVARNDANDSFAVRTEWLFLRQALGADFYANIGRIRFPAHLDSELIYIGNVYPTIAPSAEIYSELSMNHLDGISVDHSLLLGDWSLDSKFILWGEGTDPRAGGHSVSLKEMQGMAFSLSNDVLTMRLGFFSGIKSINIDYSADDKLPDGIKATLEDRLDHLTGAIRYDDQRFYASVEGIVTRSHKDRFSEVRNYSAIVGAYAGPVLIYTGFARQHTSNTEDLTKSLNGHLDPVKTSLPSTECSGYGGSMNNGSCFLSAGGTYSTFFNRQQRSIQLGMKYNITPSVVLKAQTQYLYDFDNTHGVFGTFSGPLSNKKHVYIYDVAIQTVF